MVEPIDLATIASRAAERHRSGDFIASISVFRERCKALSFGGLDRLSPIARKDISFWDNALCVRTGDAAREEAMCRRLFPSSPYAWAGYAAANGTDKADQASPAYHQWRNQMLEVQAF